MSQQKAWVVDHPEEGQNVAWAQKVLDELAPSCPSLLRKIAGEEVVNALGEASLAFFVGSVSESCQLKISLKKTFLVSRQKPPSVFA